MPLTNARKAAVLDHIYGGPDLARPATLYLGWSTTTPTETGSNFTEPTTGGYERLEIPNNTDSWEAATTDNPSIKANKIPFVFAEATGTQGTATHWGLFLADAGGTPIDWGELIEPKQVGTGDVARFVAGELQIVLMDAPEVGPT